MKCVIIAGGEFSCTPELLDRINQADLVVCADGGARHLRAIDRPPDIHIGDMDSVSREDLSFLKQNRVTARRHPVKKDQTDSELCLEYAVRHGAADITLLGATGSRMDHTLANIFLLRQLADHGISGRIIDKTNELYLVNRHLALTGTPGDCLSLIPVTDNVTGVGLSGLEFPLENESIPMGSTLGISNRFSGQQAEVTIRTGWIIVARSTD